MSKRAAQHQSRVRVRAPELPRELWQAIVAWLDCRDSVTIFSFLLSCKDARTVLAPSLARWHAEIEAIAELRRTFKPITTLPLYSTLTALDDYAKTWDFSLKMPRPKPSSSDAAAQAAEQEFHLALYYAAHIARLERAKRVDKPTDRKSLPFHTKLHLTGIQLRDAFYYDATEKKHRPLMKKPGLRTVEMTAVRLELMEQIRTHIRTRKASGGASGVGAHLALTELALSGLERVSDHLKLRALAHRLMKKELVTHKPHRQSALRDVVVDGVHLFGNGAASAAIRQSICVFSKRTLTTAQKTTVLRLAQGRQARALVIARRLGVQVKSQPQSRRGDDSDTGSDWDLSDDDDDDVAAWNDVYL